MVRERFWTQLIVAVVATVMVAFAIGVPSAVLSNSLFARMTPVPWWGYAVWATSAVLSGVLVATYIRRPPAVSSAPTSAGVMANVGSLLAVGCPVCNKLVVGALGVSGALNVWAPLQPLIAVTSLVLLGWALWRRVSTLRSCPVGDRSPMSR